MNTATGELPAASQNRIHISLFFAYSSNPVLDRGVRIYPTRRLRYDWRKQKQLNKYGHCAEPFTLSFPRSNLTF
ncbi:hypothetical protein J0676_05370 [Vibrio sp. Vb2880]|uniref:hypothetical protein n=1 Tax=Vibrio sp. Vb2880 TaxID=2816076 RepID=UPI001A8F6C25|nr:hypothetical protein [Vibrio sp. Vb2880]MBO0212907.1 hypothetical protein [Vibrio sp. Vb2880]